MLLSPYSTADAGAIAPHTVEYYAQHNSAIQAETEKHNTEQNIASAPVVESIIHHPFTVSVGAMVTTKNAIDYCIPQNVTLRLKTEHYNALHPHML